MDWKLVSQNISPQSDSVQAMLYILAGSGITDMSGFLRKCNGVEREGGGYSGVFANDFYKK